MDETGGLMQSDTRSLSDSPNGPQIGWETGWREGHGVTGLFNHVSI